MLEEISQKIIRDLFINGQQISRTCKQPFVLVNQSTVAEDGYGTLGMFLEGNDCKYFFTTCAHVIGEGDVAYSPDDNSVLGKSVLVYDSNTNNEKDLRMDFSLIHISPDSELTCTVGLKKIEGKLYEVSFLEETSLKFI